MSEEKVTYSNLEALLPEAWRAALKDEFTKPYFIELKKQLQSRADDGETIYPPIHQIFRAFELVPTLEQVKVCLIGQDPYHDDNQAQGLCFSVRKDQNVPSSLKNIYKELKTDISEFKEPNHGSLIHWAEQGVLMLNAGLTVKAHEANSHKKLGWNKFTDAVIQVISSQCEGVVFICWGAFAQKKARKVDTTRHAVLNGVHPSGLSAHKGFFGCKHFSTCNSLLEKFGKKPITWHFL
jgi:uracil-DNA glycosylase